MRYRGSVERIGNRLVEAEEGGLVNATKEHPSQGRASDLQWITQAKGRRSIVSGAATNVLG